MRILTWNLDHGSSNVTAQQQLISSLDADVAILTEVPRSMSTRTDTRVTSPADRIGKHGREAWVSINASRLEATGPPIPFERMAVAARTEVHGDSVIVYGSVLPWPGATTQASYLLRPGETSAALFSRILREQTDDVRQLREDHPGHTVIWAGDFNVPVCGSYQGFGRACGELLIRELASLDLTAWNQHLEHLNQRNRTIDLICGPSDRPALRVERFEPRFAGMTLSDHAGYVVEI